MRPFLEHNGTSVSIIPIIIAMTVIAQDTLWKHGYGKILLRLWQTWGLGQHPKQKEGHTHFPIQGQANRHVQTMNWVHMYACIVSKYLCECVCVRGEAWADGLHMKTVIYHTQKTHKVTEQACKDKWVRKQTFYSSVYTKCKVYKVHNKLRSNYTALPC